MTVRAFFEKHGFYHARGLFDRNEIEGLEHDFDRIVTQLCESGEDINATWDGAEIKKIGRKSDVIHHTHNVQKYSRRWLNAFLNEEFLDTVRQILGEDIILHHSKLFQKPPCHGSPFPIHQDWTYFPTIKNTMIAGIIHISEATDEMGCLRLFPGSHKLGRICGSSGRQPNSVLDKYPLEKSDIFEANPGDVIFFHYLTLHGSMPNRSHKTRKTVLCQLYAGDDQVEHGNKHPNEKLALRGWNHHIAREKAGAPDN